MTTPYVSLKCPSSLNLPLASNFFTKALCSNISTQTNASCLIIYFCGKQPCNYKWDNVHQASCYRLLINLSGFILR